MKPQLVCYERRELKKHGQSEKVGERGLTLAKVTESPRASIVKETHQAVKEDNPDIKPFRHAQNMWEAWPTVFASKQVEEDEIDRNFVDANALRREAVASIFSEYACGEEAFRLSTQG